MNGTRLAILLGVAGLLAPAAPAVSQGFQNDCVEERAGWTDRPRHCEVREYTLPATGGVLSVDARPNGGVQVTGGPRADILVRARVVATAATEAEAREIASGVQVHAAADQVGSEGPAGMGDGRSWHVSYEVLVPTQTSLSLRSMNGGIAVSDVDGRIDVETVNGGVRLARLAGHVRGRTTNGGLDVRLDGATWAGEGLDLETRNGGVKLSVPDGYSARLETRTVNGGLRVDFPVTTSEGFESSGRARRNRELRVDLGSGGPLIRLATTNGGINVTRGR